MNASSAPVGASLHINPDIILYFVIQSTNLAHDWSA
jgi:hypothetical protein